MDKEKFLLWIMVLLFGLQLAGCTYYMNKPAPADFSYEGNLIERDLGLDQGAQ
jgi:hypothetical protein